MTTFDGVVTERGTERTLDYQPVLSKPAGGAPSDGLWLTGRVALHGVIMPAPTTVRRPQEDHMPAWVWPGLVAWLIALGAAIGLVLAGLR